MLRIFRRYPKDVWDTCPTCNGTGHILYECQCCSGRLTARDALCKTCLANDPPCYEVAEDKWRFSGKQMELYQRFKNATYSPLRKQSPQIYQTE